ncbi:hypothetical protein DFQ26_003711 [Actinomortierella ambigua]|nr:hypothetical protein DFQ26_003711 [Actinomortierella ambigua]
MDEQQRDAAIQTAKGVAGTGRSGQSLVHRGASTSPPESPLLSPEDNPSSPAATRKRMRKKRSAPLDNESVKKVPANQPLWPIPKKFSFGNDNVVLKDDFSIQLTPPTTSTPLLDKAFTRYIRILRGKLNHTSTPDSWRSPPLPQPAAGEQHSMLAKLSIEIEDPHASLAYGMDESYTLSIHAAPRPAPETTGETPSSAAAAATATLTANTQWGVLRGLDTFVQLVHPTDPSDSLQNPASEALPTLGIANIPWTIEDMPQYAHRGLMLDTSRNYYPVKDILRTLDAMAVVKLNVFHWHVLDQQYYPLVSKAFPELTQYGAEALDRVYTSDDVAHIVQYGEERGIRVLPEFDAPGHAASWGRAFPNITVCLDAQPHQSYAAEPPAGQLNPLEPFTYKVLYTLIGEWAAQFPDNQAHTGGDEVNFNCWKTNIHLRNYIRHASRRKEYADQLVDKLRQEYDEPGLVELVRDGGGDSSPSSRTFGLGGQSGEDQLLEFFLSRLFKMYEERGKTPIVWEEMALEHDVNLPKSAIAIPLFYRVEGTGTWTVDMASGSLAVKVRAGARIQAGSEVS